MIVVYMRHYLSGILKKSKGFTLIELLIVIAILGILAVAVLSAINPVEQINRGRDTGTQSDAEQLLSAISRFNASQGFFPWQTGAADSANLCTGNTGCSHPTGVKKAANPDFGTAGNPITSGGWTVDNANYDSSAGIGAAGSNVLDVLGSGTGGQQEVQTAYINRITNTGYNFLYVYNRGTAGDSTYVCFKPQSNSFKSVATKRWNNGVACSGTSCTCTGVPADLISADVCDTTGTNANTLYCLP